MANNAVQLNGSSQYGKINNFSALDGLTDFTIEGWFKQDASGGGAYARAVSVGDASNEFARLTTENGTPSNAVNFGVTYSGTDADGYSTQEVFTLNTWVHVALIAQNGQKTKVLKNGVEISYNLQQTPTGTQDDLTGSAYHIGIQQDLLTRFFKGAVACHRVWAVAKTAQEISDNKDLYLDPAQESDLIINLNFDEASGTVVDNDATPGADLNLVGTPSWTTGPTLTAKDYGTYVTFTLDAIVANRYTATFTIDGIVKATQTTTFTIDGQVLERAYWKLNNLTMPRPKTFKREPIFEKTDMITIDGKTARDYTLQKERFIIGWEIISQAELNVLLNTIEQNEAVAFEVNDGTLVISSTDVFPFIKDVVYQIPGSLYLATVELELLEVS